jgi:pyridoxamine 5'-phosphate oxidase
MRHKREKSYRKEYQSKTLDDSGIPANPSRLFKDWLQEAIDSQMEEPLAMSLATVDAQNRPSVRIVLLRDWSDHGFVFYTNYQSRKGRDLENNPHAALCFFWPKLERQVRIEGAIEKLSPDESDLYFESRPADSQISAVISDQSQPVPNRQYLDRLFEENKAGLKGRPPGRPPWWGGYLLRASIIEFWQGRKHRLHDRIQYEKGHTDWRWQRLAP